MHLFLLMYVSKRKKYWISWENSWCRKLELLRKFLFVNDSKIQIMHLPYILKHFATRREQCAIWIIGMSLCRNPIKDLFWSTKIYTHAIFESLMNLTNTLHYEPLKFPLCKGLFWIEKFKAYSPFKRNTNVNFTQIKIHP